MPTTDRPPRGHPACPPALTLALCSLLLTAAAATLLWQDAGSATRDRAPRPDVRMRDESPTLAAETYLDAWRKQRFDLAMRVSRGRAHRQARARHDSPSEVGRTKSMDTERLTYLVDETHYESEARVRLLGVAEGRALGAPYRRRAEFTVERAEGAWRVSSMTLGDSREDASARAE